MASIACSTPHPQDTVVIDEAHALMDGDPKSAKAIITVLLTAAENKRDTLTIILAGAILF
jgi:hypothetical protein